MKKKILSLFVISLVSCSQASKVIESKVFCFDTYISTSLYKGNKDNILELEKSFTYYSKISDNYNDNDLVNVYKINKSNEEITVSKELYDLLKTSFDVKNHGAKYFNPLCGSLANKWKESLKSKQILDENIKNEEILKINSSSLDFKENNIIQRNGEAEIDLGGITKGYALDKAKDYLESQNIKSYLINGGSSSLLLGEKKNKDGLFSIGISDLDNKYIKAKNCFVSTSATSVQGVKIGDITYSHIINPFDGSAINLYDAVIVISNNGALGDALSTSMMFSSIDEIKQIEKDEDVKVLVIKDNEIKYKNESIEVFSR